MPKRKNPARIEPRKKPKQDRSIQRVEAILSAAMALVARNGLSCMTMTAIAREAQVPIGSVYQYFPERSAVLRALFDRMTERVHEKTIETFSAVRSLDHAMELLGEIIDWYYMEFHRNPADIDIWLGTEADKDLLRINVADSMAISRLFADAVEPFVPPMPGVDLEARYFMFAHLIGSVVHLSVMSDPDMAKRLLAEWKSVIRRTLFAPPAGVTSLVEPGRIASFAGAAAT